MLGRTRKSQLTFGEHSVMDPTNLPLGPQYCWRPNLNPNITTHMEKGEVIHSRQMSQLINLR